MPPATMPDPSRRAVHHAGWLLDLYAERDRIVLWLALDGAAPGQPDRLRVVDPFAPSFFVGAPGRDPFRFAEEDRRAVRAWAAAAPGLEPRGPAERLDLWTGRPLPLEELRITDLHRATPNARALETRFPDLTLYNCDFPPEIHYAYERGLFPTARGTFDVAPGPDGEAFLAGCAIADDPLATGFTLPALRTAELRAEGIVLGRRPALRSLALTAEGRTLCWEACAPDEMLASLTAALRDCDPDLVWTEGGDRALIPVLVALAGRLRQPLALDREPAAVTRRLAVDGRTYVTYGQVRYQAPDYPFFGRWHIDRTNSFWAHQTGLEGIIEVARMSKIPVQRAARRSIGTGISSIELDHAYRQGYAIPWKKSRPEGWKSAATLLKSDRGGLVYQPLTGVYENVFELDFVSMYPSIMVRENVSPETVECDCCHEADVPTVPELGYRLCQRRRGLIPRALAPIIEKRREYKRQMKGGPVPGEGAEDFAARRERCDRRQEALKWLLVCCFGYLGYRNARFGRIEAHESTCAFSREKLLTAREVCEARGWRMLHAIVDCVWIQKEGGPDVPVADGEIEELCAAIDAATNLTIAVEGRYRWLALLPSRQDEETPVPTRYFGLFAGGKLKYRGIELRRGDQAPFVQSVQERMFDVLKDAPTLVACRGCKERLLAVVREAEERLACRDVPLDELIIERRTTRDVADYRSNAMTAVAARQAVRAGVALHAGEAVRYVVVQDGDPDPDARVRIPALLGPGDSYDPAFYIEQVRRAAATIFEPLVGEPLEPLLGGGGASYSDAEQSGARAKARRSSARPRRRGAIVRPGAPERGPVQPDLFDGL